MIRRALVATGLRFLLAAVGYGCCAVALHLARPGAEPPLGGIFLVTAAVAAVLWSARGPIDRVATRVAFGGRAQGVAALDDVLRRMSESLPIEDVLPRLAQALGRDRQRAEVQLWLADGSRRVDVWPPEAADADAAVHVDVVHAGTAIGELGVGVDGAGMSPFDRRLLDELAGAAGVAMSTLRLTFDLQRRQDQLMEINRHIEASSERMRAARDVQQRRMRRELTGVVLPHIDAAAGACRAGDGGRGREQAQLALDRLRRISRGIYPPRLVEDGVGASLHGWLEMAGRTTSVRAVEPLDDLDPDVAAGVYFIAVTLIEALAATDVVLRRAGAVELVVQGDDVADTDLVTLAQDRAEAFDGQLQLTPPATVTCRIPVDREGDATP